MKGEDSNVQRDGPSCSVWHIKPRQNRIIALVFRLETSVCSTTPLCPAITQGPSAEETAGPIQESQPQQVNLSLWKSRSCRTLKLRETWTALRITRDGKSSGELGVSWREQESGCKVTKSVPSRVIALSWVCQLAPFHSANTAAVILFLEGC